MELESLNKDRKRKKTAIDTSLMIAKVPPQCREVEETLLGIILLTGRSIELVEPILKPHHFYVEANQIIYASMISLFSRHVFVETLSVFTDLKEKEQLDNIGGQYRLIELTKNVVTYDNLEHYAQKIIETFKKREVIRISGKFIGEAYEESAPANELIDEMNKEIDQINSSAKVLSGVGMIENLGNFLNVLEDRINKAKNGEIQGITSGFKEIDELTNGWQRTDLITIAAMSSVGKTAYGLNLARNAAMSNIPVAFFTREMSKQQLMERLIAMESKVELGKIKSGRLDDQMYKQILSKGIKNLETAPLYIIPASGMTWMDIRRTTRQLKRKYGVQMIVDDYIQIGKDIDTKGKNREQIIATISGENKITAQELDIAFIQLSQVLGKEIAKRDNKVPTMQDVRESEAITNDSNIVMMLYRPEYHGLFHGESGESLAGKTFVKFVKFRDGQLGKQVELRSNLAIQKFFSPDENVEIYKGSEQGFIFNPSTANQQFDEGIKAEDEFSFIKK